MVSLCRHGCGLWVCVPSHALPMFWVSGNSWEYALTHRLVGVKCDALVSIWSRWRTGDLSVFCRVSGVGSSSNRMKQQTSHRRDGGRWMNTWMNLMTEKQQVQTGNTEKSNQRLIFYHYIYLSVWVYMFSLSLWGLQFLRMVQKNVHFEISFNQTPHLPQRAGEVWTGAWMVVLFFMWLWAGLENCPGFCPSIVHSWGWLNSLIFDCKARLLNRSTTVCLFASSVHMWSISSDQQSSEEKNHSPQWTNSTDCSFYIYILKFEKQTSKCWFLFVPQRPAIPPGTSQQWIQFSELI